MKRLEKIFFNTPMTWKRVILLSVLCGIVPGLLMVPRFLLDTSFQQPGISFEFWIAAALFIALNCARPVEAGLKTFVFFLISQPLIYLVQVPFASLGWQIFSYYPRWGILTLCTLPGGMLAWFTRKGNVWSVLLFSVVNALLCLELPSMALSMVRAFPKHLLTVVFIIAEIVFFIRLLFREKHTKRLAWILTLVMLIAGTAWLIRTETNTKQMAAIQLEGETPFTVIEASEGAEVHMEDDMLWVTVREDGCYTVTVEDARGERITKELTTQGYESSWLDVPEE